MSILSTVWSWFRGSKPRAAFDPSKPLSHVFVDVDAGVPIAELLRIAPGLQAQLRDDFAPEWGVGHQDIVRVRAHLGDPAPQPGEVQIQLHKDAPPDEAGALAIHDKTADGTPIIHAYAGLAAQAGVSLSSCVSHELLEARADPEINVTATLPDGRVVAVEVCDQVEQLSYIKLGAEVSDFNTKANFGLQGGSAKWDFLGKQPNQFEVMPGGYAQVLTDDGWTQLQPDRKLSAYRAELDRLGLGRGVRRAARHQSRWQRLCAWLGL